MKLVFELKVIAELPVIYTVEQWLSCSTGARVLQLNAGGIRREKQPQKVPEFSPFIYMCFHSWTRGEELNGALLSTGAFLYVFIQYLEMYLTGSSNVMI